MRHRSIYTVLAFLLIAATAVSRAPADEGKKPFAGNTKYLWYHADYDVNPDGTDVLSEAWGRKVLTEQGITEANQTSVSFSDRLQTITILSAYTLKQDGRKIEVP